MYKGYIYIYTYVYAREEAELYIERLHARTMVRKLLVRDLDSTVLKVAKPIATIFTGFLGSFRK